MSFRPLSRSGPLVLALSLALCPSCRDKTVGQSPTPADSSEPGVVSEGTRVHPLGELGHARDYTMSVDSVKECPMDPPYAAKKGSVKIGVEVAIVGSSGLEVPVNPFYATLTDVSGTPHTATLSGCEPALPSVRVTKGRTAQGFMTFEVPKVAQKLELRYAPVVVGSPAQELRFSVVR